MADPIPLLATDWTLEEKTQFLMDLKEARWSGANRVKFRERDVTYRSDAELKAAIDDLTNELAPGRRRRRASSVAVTRSGL